MMALTDYYEKLATASYVKNTTQTSAYIFLYPWSSSEKSACQSGGIAAEAVTDLAETLWDNEATNAYGIYRFKIEDYNSLDDEGASTGSFDFHNDFEDYLRGNTDSGVYENGTGNDLLDIQGNHQLIHSGPGCTETAGGYAPDGAGGLRIHTTAFDGGTLTFSPLCNDDGLTKCAAKQESAHLFCDPAKDDQWTGQYDDQHSLGEVYPTGPSQYDLGEVTPFITYHWDDSNVGYGSCTQNHDIGGYYWPYLTDCGIDAIKNSNPK